MNPKKDKDDVREWLKVIAGLHVKKVNIMKQS